MTAADLVQALPAERLRIPDQRDRLFLGAVRRQGW